ncbi:NAD(P)-dependent dehydrogenase, short-chain alcohol dehydrogenase family [Tardiphaga sp. OK246]|uniref:SDR family NAD(P)-dependent oxidoreductase n=1 Tax=Tardiphaga sp. OK246 TaxID=1855307 RepID=UPI000B648796|nr:SDR family oxidoreductase [Tardiphaga sp. OK246]SNT32370.1 NAD(P)-dependent dehydrogenase, short-chain alcohol dehydrogenase family [Tardiphaga sp. OK246]
MQDLAGKKALVTGAARGIGAAIAVELARRGADVAITYKNSVDRADEVVRTIQGLGRRALAAQADSADAQAVSRSIDIAADQLGGLDILVNNAGVLHYGPLAEMPTELIDELLAVNVRATVLATKAAIPLLSDGGRIVSVGSCLAERVAIANVVVYSMSKSALLSFTRGLARELGPRGITVNLVHPGPTDTDMNPAEAEGAEGLRAQMALGRFGAVEDVAKSVAFLVGPAGRHITGTGLTIDGGMNA